MNDAAGDDEILDVFAEEAGEVFETIDNLLRLWREQPSDRNALTEIRRGFHTLKGSGRMVNALDLAEVAWKIENMLNRVLDRSVSVSVPMIDLVATAGQLLPAMLDAFKNQRPLEGHTEVETLMTRADALAAGAQEMPTAPVPATAEAAADTETGMTVRLADLERKLGRFRQRADEALHRSEMALQQVRRLASHIEAREGAVQDRVGRAEINRIIERVNFLAREAVELRRAFQRLESEHPPEPRELGRLVDQRVRDRLAPHESRQGALEQRLEHTRRAARTSRALAWIALILSLVLGAGVVLQLAMSPLTAG